MSEWDHRTSQHLHSVPVHRAGRDFTRRQIYTVLALVAAIVAVIVAVIWQDKPATSAADGGRAIVAAAAPTTTPGTPVPTPTPTPRAVEKSPPVPGVMLADGTYLVGKHIKTGTYITPGPADAGKCYWARLRDTSGEQRAVIAASYKRGQQIVTIRRGDRAFVTDGCGPWELVKP
ncbi:MAG TPA: hypothetical protein VIQ30_00170 [Pseudonocardia sp.]